MNGDFEIPFDDKKRPMEFYSDVFGWKLTDMAEMVRGQRSRVPSTAVFSSA